ncbi:unnamed protein product [Mytilus coruscus]|uniref:C-type lectin domain-containing protein n=1 Tax=Mytilus coruscus TaxID=42192 RepID=A0A6J8CTK3_MYTCO|nr:unnamed protein product [Mytilus coruscus]
MIKILFSIFAFTVCCNLLLVKSAIIDNFITERDKEISINTPATIVGSKLACTSLCLKDNDCCFANYRDETKECILGTLDKCHAATKTAIGWLLLRKGKAYNNKVFFYLADALSWFDAQAYCNSFGMRLATVGSSNENEFLKSVTNRLSGIWLGGSDLLTEGNWNWDKPSRKITYFDWGRVYFPQPDNLSSDPSDGDCLIYSPCDPYGTKYQWADQGCRIPYPFLCERIVRVDNGTWPVEFNKTIGST